MGKINFNSVNKFILFDGGKLLYVAKKLMEEGCLTKPKDFRGWTDGSIIDMYTVGEYIRPWQLRKIIFENLLMANQ